MGEVGYAEAVPARKAPDSFQISDGRLRAETTPDAEMPFLAVDVTDSEADYITATHDTMSSVAKTEATVLQPLLAEL